jgi:hypothetical protein
MADNDEGFLSRWSKRKALVKQGEVAPAKEPAPPADSHPNLLPASVKEQMLSPSPAQGEGRVGVEPQEKLPQPTMDDVAALTKESDFSRFVAPHVDPSVKNAAMKKLFASEPQFNVMDGLDVYIDDYNKFEPIAKSTLRQLVTARMLGLIDDELEEQPKPDSDPAAAHENADLQLQPNDAAGRSGDGDLDQGAAASGPESDAVRDPVPPSGA